MSTPLLFLTIDMAVFICALLIAIRALTVFPGAHAGQLLTLLSIGMACAVVLGRQDYGYWTPPEFRLDVGQWASVLNLARNSVPGLLMILCHSLFTDRRPLPIWLLVLLGVQLLLEEPGRELLSASWPLTRLFTQTAPALLQTLFVGLSLYWTLADWRVDLVRSRRHTRALILLSIGLPAVATVLLTRLLIDPDIRTNYLVHVALTASYLPIQVFVLFQLMDGKILADISGERGHRARRDRDSGTDAQLQTARSRLNALLNDEQICQQPGLSLQALSDRVGLPVYRLRRLIHEELGYRNFNALLHDYRVKEACRQLSDPDMRRTPILTIALSVGYASVNTFNRGFLEVMAMTPSAYRAQELSSRPKLAPESE